MSAPHRTLICLRAEPFPAGASVGPQPRRAWSGHARSCRGKASSRVIVAVLCLALVVIAGSYVVGRGALLSEPPATPIGRLLGVDYYWFALSGDRAGLASLDGSRFHVLSVPGHRLGALCADPTEAGRFLFAALRVGEYGSAASPEAEITVYRGEAQSGEIAALRRIPGEFTPNSAFFLAHLGERDGFQFATPAGVFACTREREYVRHERHSGSELVAWRRGLAYTAVTEEQDFCFVVHDAIGGSSQAFVSRLGAHVRPILAAVSAEHVDFASQPISPAGDISASITPRRVSFCRLDCASRRTDVLLTLDKVVWWWWRGDYILVLRERPQGLLSRLLGGGNRYLLIDLATLGQRPLHETEVHDFNVGRDGNLYVLARDRVAVYEPHALRLLKSWARVTGAPASGGLAAK